jgi:hypothetical protein
VQPIYPAASVRDFLSGALNFLDQFMALRLKRLLFGEEFVDRIVQQGRFLRCDKSLLRERLYRAGGFQKKIIRF